MADSNIKIGVSTEGVAKAKTELNSVKDAGEQVAQSTEKISKSNQNLNQSYRGVGGQLRNTSYQLQDLIVQIQGGTSVTTALSQQLPQLLSGFGMFGVMAGVLAAAMGIVINNLDLFSTKTEKAMKVQKTANDELRKTIDVFDLFAESTKLLSTRTANYIEDWVVAFRKGNEEVKKGMLERLEIQATLADLAAQEARQNLASLLVKRGLLGQDGAGASDYSGMAKDIGIMTAEDAVRKAEDFAKRIAQLRRGDLAGAMQGGEKQESLTISIEQRIQALQSEAKYIGVSNAEREYGVMLAELEAQAKRAGLGLDKQQIELLKQLVMERDSARSIDKLNQYVVEQQKNIDLVKLEGQAVGMSARQHKQLVDARNLEMQIAKETQGMQQKDAQAYADTARSLFLVKQALEDVNYANSRAFGTGATNAIKDYMKGLGDAAKDANNLFSNAFKGMEDAMVDAFSTGKLSFKSMIDTMMADITRLIIRQALLKPLYQSMGLTEGGGGFNVGSLLSAGASLFGNVGTAATYGTSVGSQQTAMLAAQDAGLPFFADGTNNIPYDNYPAILHKGEAVVPAKYNPAVGGMGTGNITYSPTINIDSRTDANEVRALVGRAVQQGQFELVDKINRGQVRIRT